ncbi:MAG: 3'(2'),5'-bisphosphate nucleotidase CysQ [Bacteroidia bacterium]|nr:3'(2'),5'-bisphosphate nucleotidase CysQ [Bacteroidia bacterium]
MTNYPPLSPLLALARQAGSEIMRIYDTADFESITDYKSDSSPLTLADKASHAVIEAGLQRLHPEIPILSEEGKDIPYAERKEWRRFWCVDPLDGTKEFLKRNGEFTVNIALIQNGEPVLGVVYVPAKDWMFWNEPGIGAFVVRDGHEHIIHTRDFDSTAPNLTVVASRSHQTPEVEEYLKKLKSPQTTAMGSSLKFMLLALGEADIYPRLAPTMEWDTAAAQAVLVAAGGKVIQADTRLPLRYNKENLLNPWFIAAGKGDLPA